MENNEMDAAVNGSGEGDSTDAFNFASGNSKRSAPTARMVVQKEAYFYKMDHPNRGIAVIFNHESFIVPSLKPRNGTQADCDNLKSCWEKIGFTVSVHKDFGIKALMDEIESLSRIDYSKMDCLVICVLSHGEEGLIYARDAAYKQENLWEKFTADKCPTLAGKPKLFFIQACQGRRLDPGISLKSEVDGNASSYKIPIHADFLFAYSTIPGTGIYKKNVRKRSFWPNWKNIFKSKSQLSNKNESYGYSENGLEDKGWFIKALIAELDENAFKDDLLALLTFVIRRVEVDYKSLVSGDNSDIIFPQPYISSMLTRLVMFKLPQRKL